MRVLEKGYQALRRTAKRSAMLRRAYHTLFPAKLPTIRKAEVEAKIRAEDFRGIVHPRVGQERVIVSLTSFPARLEELPYTLYSLLNQDLPLSGIRLWLKSEEFPHPFSSDLLPASLRAMERYGVEICWIDENIRSYAKLVPVLMQDPEAIVITADDDLYYPPDWASRLYREHLKHPEDIIAHRAHGISYDESGQLARYLDWPKEVAGGSCRYANFATTGGGVLYPPQSLAPEAVQRDLFLKLAPKADDVWFWAMAVRNHRKIRIPEDHERGLVYNSEETQKGPDRLSAENVEDGGNDAQLRAVLDAFPDVEALVKEEHEYCVLPAAQGPHDE